MKVVDCKQGTSEWLQARAGIPTASEFDNLITPTGEIRKGQTPQTYLMRKLAEGLMNGPLLTGGGFAMDQGNLLEGEAIPLLRFELEWKIDRVGFVTTDDGRVGASPDGLIGDDSGCEIKCPELPTAIKYFLARTVPPEYVAQVQGSMYVTGRPSWRFVSYNRQLPIMVVHVQRDPIFHAQLKAALDAFISAYDSGLQKIRAAKLANVA